MSYKTILVHLELEGDNEGVLSIAAQLGERFDARVIGIAAAQPIHPLYEEGLAMSEVIAIDRAELTRQLDACRVQFRDVLETRVRQMEWRSSVTFEFLADYIAEEARCADLVITGKDLGASLLDHSRRVNLGNLALKAGRPILIVPQGIARLAMQHVFLAWKDTREARRAAVDALPLFAAAGHVNVLEVTSEPGKSVAESRVRDVSKWLENHNISATAHALGGANDQTGCLRSELVNRKCDLLVAGAFGHNRLGEWIFGGVTQDVLLDPDFCVLLSH